VCMSGSGFGWSLSLLLFDMWVRGGLPHRVGA
jgi:hypothetical protein